MKKLAAGAQAAVIMLFTGLFLLLSPSVPAAVLLAAAGMVTVAAVGLIIAGASEHRLRGQVTTLSRELAVAVSRVASVSQEIRITIGESNAISDELSGGTREMSALISEVFDDLDTLIFQLKGMVGFSEEARALSQKMEQTGRTSFDSANGAASDILGIVGIMSQIKVTSGRMEASVGQLKSASLDAHAIIDTIGNISRQMHIIAINASVEAVRAGRFGESFAVVAREFQSLSSMTDKALGEIDGLLGSIGADIDRVTQDIRLNSDRVDEGVRHTKGVEDNLRAISSSFTGILAVADSLSGVSGAQWRLADEMSARIGDVETLVGQAGDQVRSVNESVSRQKQSVENIAAMGMRLAEASRELSAVADSGAGNLTEALDTRTESACAAFFPVLERELAHHPALAGAMPEAHGGLLRAFKTAHPIVEAVWTNAPNGRFICSIPPSGIANAAMRDWFRAALKGEKYISSIYISGITKNRCVTLSIPYYDEAGELLGVAGADLNLGMLLK